MIYRERLEQAEKKLAEIEHKISQPDAVKDKGRYQKLTKELAGLRPLVTAFVEYRKIESELAALEEESSQSELDEEMGQLYRDEQAALKERADALRGKMENLLLRGSDPRAGRDVIMEIRAGTGGEEAGLFAASLYRMYTRYAADKGCRCETIEVNDTGIGGIKEVIFAISGNDAYSLLKYESGIHRVQRVPQTESSGRIHTSAVTVALMVEADESEVDIDPSDLKIDVYRASGAGGQHVNKTESAVRITHLPTGVVVTCQDERSQHKNKAKAMRVLRARIYEAQEQKRQKEEAQQRKSQVGTGDRSGKIRTYNFPEQRVTDHRIGLTLHSLNDILNGHLDDLVGALERDERERKLTDAA